MRTSSSDRVARAGIAASDVDERRTTRARYGPGFPDPPVFNRLAHHRSVEASKSRPLANSPAVSPLARHSRTRSDHFAAVDVMRANVRARRHPRKDGASCSGYAPASKLRPKIVPRPAVAAEETVEAEEPAKRAGSRYRPWAELLKRCFAVDVLACPRCGGRMRLVALVTEGIRCMNHVSRVGPEVRRLSA